MVQFFIWFRIDWSIYGFKNSNDISEIWQYRANRWHKKAIWSYLFLNLSKGTDDVIKLHDLLYKNEFAELDVGLRYVPHITVGKFENENKLNEAYEKMKGFNGKFYCVVDKISVEMIGTNEESIIIIEKRLS